MSEIKNSPRIRELKQEIVIRTLHPHALHDYMTEDERSVRIDALKNELGEFGIDAEAFQRAAVAENLGIAATDNVVEVDFAPKAS